MLKIPGHCAIIMDGNGRWAKKQGKPRSYGHYKGADNMHDIAIDASDLGVKVLTLYAFSTENWIRPKKEVEYLMSLPSVFFRKYIDDLMAHQIRVSMIGEEEQLPAETRKVLDKAFERTAGNTGMRLVFALNYGSRREIELAVREIVEEGIPADQITQETIRGHLFTRDYPDVDLLIRTSGELRLSNFLLWQIAYAELVFQDVLWPDYSKEDLLAAFEEYGKRDRRFGGVRE